MVIRCCLGVQLGMLRDRGGRGVGGRWGGADGNSRLYELFVAINPVANMWDGFREEDVEGWVEDESFRGGMSGDSE